MNYNDKTFECPDGTLENGKKTGEIRLQKNGAKNMRLKTQ
jgi:hypothetical protein